MPELTIRREHIIQGDKETIIVAPSKDMPSLAACAIQRSSAWETVGGLSHAPSFSSSIGPSIRLALGIEIIVSPAIIDAPTLAVFFALDAFLLANNCWKA